MCKEGSHHASTNDPGLYLHALLVSVLCLVKNCKFCLCITHDDNLNYGNILSWLNGMMHSNTLNQNPHKLYLSYHWDRALSSL